MDVGITIKVGFFLRDLHQQIKQLYDKQSTNRVQRTVYRGQGIYNEEFEKLRSSKGGLLSFNSFLSTSVDLDVSKMYCPISAPDPNVTAVLFKIEIDPTLTCAPFAFLGEETNFSDEQEVLFSMHSVFRIVEVRELENGLWQVELLLTSDDDKELKQLTEYIRKEVQGGTEWHQLGQLLIKIGKFDKAEEIYRMLIKQTPENDSNSLVFFYNQIGIAKHYQGEFQEALVFYSKRLEIEEKFLFPNPPGLATTYNNIASIHSSIGNYPKALEFYEKTLKNKHTCHVFYCFISYRTDEGERV